MSKAREMTWGGGTLNVIPPVYIPIKINFPFASLRMSSQKIVEANGDVGKSLIGLTKP